MKDMRDFAKYTIYCCFAQKDATLFLVSFDHN